MARNRALGVPLQTRVITKDHTLHFGTDYYLVNAGPVTLTLDPYAVDNDQVVIQDITDDAKNEPITILASEGQTILNGYGDSISIATNGGALMLTMTPDGWAPVFLSGGSSSSTTTATAAVVTSANSPYAVKNTDVLIEFDESNGNLATAVLPAPLAVGEKHTFIWWGWAGGSPPPQILDGGNLLVPYAVGAQTSKQTAALTVINSQGGRYTVEWDGTQWMCTNAQ